MNKNFIHVRTDSPIVPNSWKAADLHKLKNEMIQKLKKYSKKYELIELCELKNDGQVIVNFTCPVSADKRGGLLLDLEELLKNEFDQGVTVWLEPLGDRNSLRNLRGIKVKKHE